MTPRSADAAQCLVGTLTARGQRIAVAESLTGGSASLRLTHTEGAADVFVGGIVCYQTVAKHQLLDVSPGPVISRRCAVDMADSAATQFGTDVAVAFTGIAGAALETEAAS
jgi:nicotinamide-nucleotide amidase